MARTPPQDTLLLFTPHVPQRLHSNGWTPDRQRCFIAALARTGVVSAAAASVGMSARSAYQLRTRVLERFANWAHVPMAPEMAAQLGPGYIYSFAAASDRALGNGRELQIDAATPVAIEGDLVPVVRRGRIVGWQRKFNMRLALAALGAFRRSYEGQWYDDEVRIAKSTQLFVEKIETLLRKGPIRWPDEKPPESPEERLARMRRERAERRRYGPREGGMLDPRGPADQPPRPLALQNDDWRKAT